MDRPPFIRLDSSHPLTADTWRVPSRRPSHVLVCDGAKTRLSGYQHCTWDDPLEALAWMARTFPAAGRWIGYLGYDLGRRFEVLPEIAADDLGLPLFAFAFCPDEAPDLPPEPATGQASAADSPPPAIRSNFTREAYLAAVARAIDYIAAGDIFQVNLSQRLSVPTTLSPLAVYQRLLERTPAWYGGLLDFGDFALVSNSPELFFRIEPQTGGERQIVTRPIKGTRPRRPGMERELLDSVKDQAELNMIVDLERNDLGRICRIGSVRVTEPRVIEAHPTVYHGAATIEGMLRPEVGFVDVLRAVFPGGSITGAPKIRAMEIIEELEPVRRGAYCGAIGYLDQSGRIEFNIAIRTMTMRNHTAYIPVGGGIVADSEPVAEYDETLTKARALLAALGFEVT